MADLVSRPRPAGGDRTAGIRTDGWHWNLQVDVDGGWRGRGCHALSSSGWELVLLGKFHFGGVSRDEQLLGVAGRGP